MIAKTTAKKKKINCLMFFSVYATNDVINKRAAHVSYLYFFLFGFFSSSVIRKAQKMHYMIYMKMFASYIYLCAVHCNYTWIIKIKKNSLCAIAAQYLLSSSTEKRCSNQVADSLIYICFPPFSFLYSVSLYVCARFFSLLHKLFPIYFFPC